MQLVVNPGSTSKKYALMEGDSCLLFAHFEIRESGFELTLTENGKEHSRHFEDAGMYETAVRYLASYLKEKNYLDESKELSAIGTRIVAPGIFFTSHKPIDDAYVAELERMRPLDPQHIGPTLREIAELKEVFSGVRLYAVSDSAFHTTRSEAAKRYPLKSDDPELSDIQKFGYHGLSVASIVRKLSSMENGGDFQKVIVCHVGGGISITALDGGESVATSMGFSPFGGVPMLSRSGDMDPMALIATAKQKHLSLDELQEYVAQNTGLALLAGNTTDMKVLLERYQKEDKEARLAIDMLVSSLHATIGAYIALLRGVDLIVLTATVCERNAFARSLIVGNLAHLGVRLDSEKNEGLLARQGGFIDMADGGVAVAVVHTDEMQEIAAVLSNMIG